MRLLQSHQFSPFRESKREAVSPFRARNWALRLSASLGMIIRLAVRVKRNCTRGQFVRSTTEQFQRNRFARRFVLLGGQEISAKASLGVCMSGGRTILHLLTKAGIGLGALFLVGVLLAAIPNHRTPVVAGNSGEPYQDPQQPSGSSEQTGMPSMDMEDARASEHTAMADMATMHHGDSAHMHMTAMRRASAADQQRANEIADKLRA